MEGKERELKKKEATEMQANTHALTHTEKSFMKLRFELYVFLLCFVVCLCVSK